MKAAILMAQSDYQNVNKLPACKNDLTHMTNLIEETHSYDKVIIIDDKTSTASDAKDKIIQFVETSKGEQLDEIFLYFSGHGDFDGKEFYYVWSDYLNTKKRQTCLQNSEIDALIKQLSPKMVIKVVDACHSGIPYVKDNDSMAKFLTSSEKDFNKCYFLFSSQNDEYALADSNASYFTDSFLQSMNQDIGKKVRYKDIIDYISDYFDQNGKQTPFFVTQADFTDVFCIITEQIRELVKGINAVPRVGPAAALPAKSSLFEIIKKDSEKYVPYNVVTDCLTMMHDEAQKAKPLGDLSECFTVEIENVETYEQIPQIKNIASWINKQGSEIYADVNYEDETYTERVPKNNYFSSLAISASIWKNYDINSSDNYEVVTRTRRSPRAFVHKFDLPYKGIIITYKALLPNLLNYSFFIIPLLSRTKLHLFVTKVNYIRTTWDEQKIDNNSAKWAYVMLNYSDKEVKDKINELLNNTFHNEIKEELNTRFGKKEENEKTKNTK